MNATSNVSASASASAKQAPAESTKTPGIDRGAFSDVRGLVNDGRHSCASVSIARLALSPRVCQFSHLASVVNPLWVSYYSLARAIGVA
ncbi:MAG: hypothetical protein HKO71_06910 [Pseudomonadales bacterium]|nr:hypothetical protein [Pseudomonadales bacterium]